MNQIDLNLDIGEHDSIDAAQSDLALLPLVSSLNIACGGHAGNEAVMDAIVSTALPLQLALGAHPSYPDRLHFGRQSMAMPARELFESLHQQVQSLIRVCAAHGTTPTHIKPHGALYNDASDDDELCDVLIQVTRTLDAPLPIVIRANSRAHQRIRAAGLVAIGEAFIDRRYDETGRLVARTLPRALIDDLNDSAQQALHLVLDQRVPTLGGAWLPCHAQTLCVHGDHVGALSSLRHLRQVFSHHHIAVRPWHTKDSR